MIDNYLLSNDVFPENVVGCDQLYIIGDNFAARSYCNHFKKHYPMDHKHFIKENFDFQLFCGSHYTNSNSNMISRIQNSFAAALNSNHKTEGLLPKYFLIVLDDDLITYLDCKKSDGVATLFGTWIEWLVKYFNEMIAEHIQQLPKKGRKITPFLYWVTAPFTVSSQKIGTI